MPRSPDDPRRFALPSPTQDVRLAFKRLLRAPGYAAVSVATLALGIAATVTTFSVVQSVLLAPLPFADESSLVSLRHRAPGITSFPVTVSQAMYLTYVEDNRSFDAIGMFSPRLAVVTEQDPPQQVAALRVTQSLLPLLGVRPELGRLFEADDDLPESPDRVLISHGFWQRQFGADPQVLGKTLRIEGAPHEILGVLPSSFELPRIGAEIVLPARIDPNLPDLNDYTYNALARLRDGASIEGANEDIRRMLPISVERYGGTTKEALEDMQWGPDIVTLRTEYVGTVEQVLWILMGASLLVLVVGCSNVANLFLVRAEGRQQEVSLRTALGSSRIGIAQLFLSESTLLALGGGLLGAAAAQGALGLIGQLGTAFLPRSGNVGLNGPVLLFALAITVGSALAVGLFPLPRLLRAAVAVGLKEGGRGSVGGSRQIGRRLLVASQVAGTFVLLVGSGLMIRTFSNLSNTELGLDHTENVQTLRISIPESEVPSSEEVALLHEQIARSLQQLPGVDQVGGAQSMPMGLGIGGEVFWIEAEEVDFSRIPPVRLVKAVLPGYQRTLGIPLLVGRSIEWDDVQQRRPVVVISEDLAREWFEDPVAALGRRISIGHPTAGLVWREIVGVVDDVREFGPSQEAQPAVYWPYAGMSQDRSVEGLTVPRSLVFALRSSERDLNTLLPEARAAIQRVNRNLPISEELSMSQLMQQNLGPYTFTLMMLMSSAVIALVLGMVGVYAVMSYLVSQRTREIGVRMAFGASAGDVTRLILRQGIGLAAVGVLIGLVAAGFGTRLMKSLLVGVRASDPATFVAVAVLLCLMVLLACLLPARRAARIEPARAVLQD